ncbi:MAG: 2'-5' RNA ligase family protein [Acidimicrobiales bacterium]
MIPPPVSVEVDGLRRALGDRQLGRIEPHITLVPPINVREDEVAAAMAVVQEAASGREPMSLTIGPLETFGVDSRVRFLAVDPWEPISDLQRACWSGVLDRPKDRPFHPHVTVDIDGSPIGAPDPALDVLANYAAEVTIDRVTVLEHRVPEDGDEPGNRTWETYLAYRLN